MESLLICTDLDRTLIPNGIQPESPNARRRFAALVARPEVTLVYVSGRHRALVQQAIQNYQLPQPDYVVGDVGTTIYRVGESRAWQPSTGWEDEIGRDWQGSSHQLLKQLFADLHQLRLQEVSKQNSFKLSYYVPLQANHHALIAVMRERLEELGVRSNLVWSIDEAASVGLLDLLPARASKLHSVEFLMGLLGFDPEHTVFAGDSGNDMEVLVSGLPSVLVANSQPGVRNQALQGAEQNGTLQQLYLATGGVFEMNGNYAAGILEGVAHYHPELARWIGETSR